MRIINEIGRPAGSTGSVDEYVGTSAESARWRGARCDLLISSQDELSDAEHVLEIEGDLDHVRAVLEEALALLRTCEQIARERVAKRAARERQCRTCLRWYDTRVADEGHGDGTGVTCFDPDPTP